MNHHWMGEDEYVRCIRCGGLWTDARIEAMDVVNCTGRTDLTHPVSGDASSHALDNCKAFDDVGDCDHLATNHGCDCELCRS